MSNSIKESTASGRNWLITVTVVVALGAVAWVTRAYWLPEVPQSETELADHHADTEHHHDDEHAEVDSIELSDQALKNIGFQGVKVELGEFERTVTIPAIVVEQPGRTQIHITAPLTGIVTDIKAVQGQAVEPGRRLFSVRLTHEDLVAAQKEFLQTAENLDIVNREITRLEGYGDAIAGKRIVEQQYEKQKLESTLRAAEQALLLHGLSEAQVQEIMSSRKLLSSLMIYAPDRPHAENDSQLDHLFHVQSLPVSPGQQVEAGQELCVLADHCELFVEGRAFEDDATRLREAVRQGWEIAAKLLVGQVESKEIRGLKLLFLADHVDPESRAFHFYLRLPNEIALDRQTPDGPRFIEWRFKPGQRMELRVPLERWTDRIVLPVDAIVEEGAETYAYRQNGNSFQRVPVHVEYRDRDSVVIANEGSLFPGDVVAAKGTYQIHLALKNKSGGAPDPHAGHNH
jgi:membrane fusion protein, heavy metal efflux system